MFQEMFQLIQQGARIAVHDRGTFSSQNEDKLHVKIENWIDNKVHRNLSASARFMTV